MITSGSRGNLFRQAARCPNPVTMRVWIAVAAFSTVLLSGAAMHAADQGSLARSCFSRPASSLLIFEGVSISLAPRPVRVERELDLDLGQEVETARRRAAGGRPNDVPTRVLAEFIIQRLLWGPSCSSSYTCTLPIQRAPVHLARTERSISYEARTEESDPGRKFRIRC